MLRMIPANNLYSIQVLTGPDATTYYGTSAVAGVILIETTLGGEEEEEAEEEEEEGEPGALWWRRENLLGLHLHDYWQDHRPAFGLLVKEFG